MCLSPVENNVCVGYQNSIPTFQELVYILLSKEHIIL